MIQEMNKEMIEREQHNQKRIMELNKEIERLNNIIKEVREYIEEGFKQDEINIGNIYHTMWDEIYEILKKENK